MSARVGDWCQSRTGRQLWPWDPRPEDIDARDLAYGLREPRFASQTLGALVLTVAQHSTAASYLVPPEHALAAHLHDAHEAVFKDIPAPIKRHPALREYVAAAERYQRAINAWAGLAPDAHLHPAVKHADLVLLATEARDLMAPPPAAWFPMPAPLAERVVALPPDEAAEQWLARLSELRGAP
jgi:hypothetical protein